MSEFLERKIESREVPEAKENPATTGVNTLAHKMRILALLALGATAATSAAACDISGPNLNRPDITNSNNNEWKNNRGPFEFCTIQEVLVNDGKEIGGIYFDYIISDSVDANVEVVDNNGETIYQTTQKFEEGEGELIFIEPDVTGPHTASFEGAANAEALIISGSDSKGNPFNFAASLLE